MMDYRAYYDEHVEYDEIRDETSFGHWKYTNDVLHYKIKYLREVCGPAQPESILEVGCATGFLLANLPFETPKPNRCGIDVSPRNIDFARGAHPAIEFLCGTAEEVANSTSRRFDIVVLSDILEHVEDDVALLSLCGRLGVQVVLNLPLEKCGENVTREYGPSDREGHLRAYSVDDARQLVRAAGLREVRWTVKKYVNEPVFRHYLLEKLLRVKHEKSEALVAFNRELLHVELHQDFYKDNFFALLQSEEQSAKRSGAAQ